MKLAQTASSRKAKGRRLQQWIVQKLLLQFPQLTDKDVRSTAMGSNGVDVQLSTAAHNKFPYAIECKNQEVFGGIYKMYEQAQANKGDGQPLLVIKMNGRQPLAVIDADYFIRIHNAD